MKKLMLLVLAVAPVAFGTGVHNVEPGGQGQLASAGLRMWRSNTPEGSRDQLKDARQRHRKAKAAYTDSLQNNDSSRVKKMRKDRLDTARKEHKAAAVNHARVMARHSDRN